MPKIGFLVTSAIPAKAIRDFHISVGKYKTIMNPATPPLVFEKTFTAFYRLRLSTTEKVIFFREMRSCKPSNPIVFADYLQSHGVSKFQFSFATKAVHTYNPNSPIYDSRVADYLKKYEGCSGIRLHAAMRREPATKKSRFDPVADRLRVINNWSIIKGWYASFKTDPRYAQWISWFDCEFGSNTITDTKKIDFIIWALS